MPGQLQQHNEAENNVDKIYHIKNTIESSIEIYKKEIETFEIMKIAHALSCKALENFQASIGKEASETKLSVKEIEYGKAYFAKSIEIVNKQFDDIEKKRLRAEGSLLALECLLMSCVTSFDIKENKSY